MSTSILDAYKVKQEKADLYDGKKLKVGIIGTGWISEAHLHSYEKCPDVELVAAADLIEGKAKAFCEKYGHPEIRCYRSHKEMLDAEELDAVSVCTYNATHAECSIYALEKGVNVLLEKPMCVTLEEAIAICRAEKRAERFFL